MVVNEHSGSHRLVRWARDLGCHGIGLDHGYVGLGERIGFDCGDSSSSDGRALTELARFLVSW